MKSAIIIIASLFLFSCQTQKSKDKELIESFIKEIVLKKGVSFSNTKKYIHYGKKMLEREEFQEGIIEVLYTKDQARLSITDFSKKRINTLVPYNYKTYATSLVKVKGCTNDTIKIRGIFSMNLSGKIDTIVSRDYYGTHNIRCIFDPYKATEGELIIEYSL